MRRLTALLMLLAFLVWTAPAWAVGQQFTNQCTTLSWNPNQETDLAGYKIYDRTNPANAYTLKLTVNAIITSRSCFTLGFNVGQHYVSITAFDTAGNESPHSADLPFVLVNNQISDLRVTVVNATDMTLAFTEVDGGEGLPASYDVRVATPMISWGTAASVTAGTCTTPVAGTAIGATKSCTVTGLSAATPYQFQLVPYKGTLAVDAVFGPLSNITGATTGGSVPGATNRATDVTDDFSRGNGTLPNPPWMSNYTNMANLVELSTDVRLTAGASITGSAIYLPATFTFASNQWAEMRIDALTGGSTMTLQLAVRWASTPTGNGYTCIIRKNGTYTSAIRSYTAGAPTTYLTENATTWAATDTFRCEVTTTATGETIELFRNASSTPLLSYIDTARTFLTGQPGILINDTVAGGDNWSAGHFSAPAVVDPCGCDNH